MSTTIDSRVVEMRFDNKHFESNVSTTMSTLEKLKQKLNLTGAAKGLENINTASKKVNIAGLGTAAETVGLKFNAMYTMADQALRNITNRVQNAAESMVKALTIDPVKTGLSEYETQINAVQTILANTQHNGTTLNEVNAALDTLNTYADKTIYNFTEMTRNIGTFTAAGVDLQTSVESIQGIANLAAVSGSTSQQASTAMYQLSQALAAGKVSLMDWNSVVNAGMGGKVFQDALVRTSELLKTGAKDAIATYGSFRESLTQGEWLTTEVLTETLKQLSGAYSEADLIAQGFTEDQAKEISELAETAVNAATKVKTFTQLWDTLKEAAQSGWTQTWELIIGDFEEAKELWSGISDVIGGFINKMSESRNNWLAGALNSPWEKLIDKINEAGIETEVFEEKVSQVAKDEGIDVDNLVEKYGSLEKAFKSGAITTDILKTAVDGLSKSTADLSKVTDELKFGDTGDQVKEVQQALTDLNYDIGTMGVDGIIGQYTEAGIKAFQEAQGLEVTGIIDEETLAALREATKNTNELSKACKELWENFDELGGRELVIEGLKNIFVALKHVIQPIATAFRQIFPKSTSDQLFNLIKGFHSFTEKLKISRETAEKIRITFKGIFSVFSIAIDIIKAVAKGVITLVKPFASLGGNILDVTSKIGKWLDNTRKMIKENGLIEATIANLSDLLKTGSTHFKEWFKAFLELPNVSAAIDKVKQTFSGFWKSIKGFFTGGFDGTAEDILTGLANGIKEGASVVWEAIVTVAKELVAQFCDYMGIHSPSTRMFELGQFIVQGLVNGIKAAIGAVVGVVTWLGTNISNFFAGIDWSGIFGTIQDALSKFMDFLKGVDWSKFLAIIPIAAIGIMIKMLWNFITSITNAIDGFASVIEGFRNIEDAFADVLKSFGKTLKSYGMKLKAEALNTLVNAIVKLVAAVIVLSYVPIDQVYNAVGVLVILSGLMIGITFAMDKLTKASIGFEKGKGFNAEGFNVNILAIAGCMLIMAKAMQIIGNLSLEQFAIGLTGMILVMVVIIGILETCGNIVKAGNTSGLDKIGGMLIKVSIAMLLMAAVCKIAGSLSLEDALKGAAFMLAFVVFIALLTQATRITKQEKIAKLGGLLIAISVAMMLMVGVCKLAGTLSETEIAIGAAFMLAFVGFVYMLTQATKINKKTDEIAKLGGTILAISVALLLMVGMCKLAGMLSLGDVLAGAAFMAGYAIFIKALVGILKIGKEEEMARVAGTLIAMSIAIGILAGIAVLLSFVPTEGLVKGVAAVSVLGIIMAIMTKSLKGANNVVGSIVALSIAVAVMAGAVAALTFVDGEKMAGAVLALSIVMTAFGSMAKKAGQMNKCMGTLIVMAVMIGILGGALYILAGLPIESTIGAAISMIILLNFVTKAMKTLKTATPLAKGSITSLVAMTGVLVLLGAALKILQWMNIDIGIAQAVALSILLIALSQATKVLSTVGPVAGQAAMGAVALAAVILILGGLVAALGGLVTAIPQVEEFLDRGIPVLTKIGQGIGGFIGGFIGGIAEGAMASFPGICDSIAQGMAKIGTIDSTAIEGGKALIEAMALMAGANIADTFSQWITLGKDPMLTFKENVLAFAGAMIELSTALTSGGPINSELINQLASSGTAFATLNQSLPRSGGWIDDIVGAKDLGTFGESVKAFATAMIDINTAVSGEGFSFNETAMTAMCTAGTKFVELNESLPKTGGWVQDILGEQDLANFGNSVVAFAGAMLVINASVSGEGFSFNEEAMTAMCTAGTKFVELNNALPSQDGWIQDILGSKELGTFGESVKAFATTMIEVNTAMEDVTINEKAFTALATAGTELNNLQTSLPKEGGWQQTIMGSENIALFGAKVAAFAAAMIAANTALADVTINTAAFESIVTAGEKVNELQSVLPKEGGWWEEITGKTDIEGFGEKVVAFAGAMAGLRDALGDEGISDLAVTSITKAGEALVALNDTLPEKGWFDSKEDLSDFSTHITNFSTSLTDFNTMASGLNADGIETAMTTATKMKEFIDTLATIDISGVSTFTGVGTGGVGADGPLADIGAAMNVFSEKVAGLDTAAVSTAAAAALKLKTLINGLVGLDTSGVELFKPEKIGSAMKSYADKVAGIDTAVVLSSVTSANRLKTFISGLAGIDTSGVEKFKLGTIGSTLKAYNSHVSSMDFGAVSSSISSANRLRNFVSSLAGLDTSGVGSFTSAIDKLGTISIDSVVKAFSGSTSKLTSIGSNIVDALTKGLKNKQSSLTSAVTTLLTAVYRNITYKLPVFKNAGSKVMDMFVTGLSSKKSKISSTITSSLSSAVTSARNYYNSFYSAGSYLVSGFASGISANTWRAEAKAKAMANAAEQAAREALAINSPSKVFAAIGSGVVEGFVKGIDDNVSDTDIAVSNMADVARNGFGNAISKINDYFNSDMDAQPTIRPVLDLTEVETGAGAIAGMFGMTPSVGVLSNVGTINSMMNDRIQNGGNTDVVSAINKLRKDLGNVGGTNYNINGITYDDGTNVSEAVKSIVRAARVERRI